MCITIRVITGDYSSKSDSKEEDRRSGTVVALRVDETIRKAIDWQQGMTRRNKPQLPWFCNSCDKHHYHRSSFSFVWKSRCFCACFCIACYLCSFASQQTIKVAYVTSLGGLCPKAALFEIFGWTVNMYVCVYNSYFEKGCRLLPGAKMLLVPMNISLTGRLYPGGVYILTEQTATCFMLRGHATHIDFLWLLFLVDMIDDLPSDASSIFFYLF